MMLSYILPAYDEESFDSDRLKSMAKARKILRTNPRFLDTETTGLNNAFLVEICVLSHHGGPLINTLVKPPIPIPPETTKIHGIDDTTVADAPTFPEIYSQLKAVLEGCDVVIYNASFDTSIIENCCQHYELPMIEFTSHCAMKIYSQYYGEFSSYWGNYKWQKLPGGGKHRAYSDTKACYNLMRAMSYPERCEWNPPPKQFPPTQVFCEWQAWIELTARRQGNWGWEKLFNWRIKKPVFCIKGQEPKEGKARN